MSPTARTKKQLEEEGWTVAVSEHWNPFSKRRVDLFGFTDLVALKPNTILAVQATSWDHVSDRVRKILALPAALEWLRAGGKILVTGWGKRDGRWRSKEKYLTEDDFMGA